MSKLKIAFFLDVMQEDFDGVSITMHQVFRRIPGNEIEPIFITPQPPINDIGFPVYQCPYMVLPEKGKEYRLAFPKRMKNLVKLLDDFHPDIIHFSSPTYLGWYAYRYATKNNIPVTTIYHTHYHSFLEYYFRKIPFVLRHAKALLRRIYGLYLGCDRVFAPTLSMKKYLLSEGVKEENLSIWGRGVDTDRFDPIHKNLQHWAEVPAENLKVLFVSRLVKEKEPQTLIRLNQLLKDRSNISLIIVGDGPTRVELERKIPDAHFVGSLFGDDLAKAYASADIFIFPSTTETFGNVVLEAMASGLPVIAANAGGPADIVKEGETGVLVEPRNEQAFYDAIVTLAENPNLLRQMSDSARAYAKSQNWENLCDELFKAYKLLMKRGR